MAEGSGGPGHLVAPADRLARVAHDPQHVGERQLADFGCFLPDFLISTAGGSLGAASARPFSTVFVHRAPIKKTVARGFGTRFICTTIRYSTQRPARRSCAYALAYRRHYAEHGTQPDAGPVACEDRAPVLSGAALTSGPR